MERCPRCKSDRAYVGLLDVKCVNENCPHYDPHYAYSLRPAKPPPDVHPNDMPDEEYPEDPEAQMWAAYVNRLGMHPPPDDDDDA